MSQVTTFYSYKGGSGRSMTMANVAWALAMNGERVLAIDWDLEAPGIHRYFHPFLSDPDQRRTEGLIDRVWDFATSISDGGNQTGDPFALANCADIVQHLDIPLTRAEGCLHLLGAGRQDDDYSRKVGGLDWREFYERFGGKRFLDLLIEWARAHYTHILIDSRTGVADTAGICTAQLPDAVVMCFVYNRQSIEGTAAVVRSITETRTALKLPRLHMHVLPCRVEERGAVDAARRYSTQQLADILGRNPGRFDMDLRKDEVRHHAWCAFEEKLAIFEDVPGERGSLLQAMHDLARKLARQKKSFRIVPVEPEILSRYWRRAAFADPRLAELEELNEQPMTVRLSRVMHWVEEVDDEDRPDWLMGLCEAAVDLSSIAEATLSPSLRDYLGDRSVLIARHVYGNNRELYSTRFANILTTRAAHFQREGQGDAAVSLLEESTKVLAADTAPLATWRLARTLEKLAEARMGMGDYERAFHEQDRAVEIYLRRDDRTRLVYEMDLPLALAKLSELHAVLGRSKDAVSAARMSMNLLQSTSSTVRARNAAETMSVILTWVDITSRFEPEKAQKVLSDARHAAEQMLGGTEAGKSAATRLDISLAQLLLRQARYPEALNVIEALENWPDGLDHSALASIKIPALVGMNRAGEAIDYLIDGINDGRLPVAIAGSEYVKAAATSSGRLEDLLALVLGQLQIGENWVEALAKVVGSGPTSPAERPKYLTSFD